ncbi:MAG TPA: DUF3048 domain-containing protein [Candidatus Binatia bacterium]|jgi:hypothetical protein|nr:DUF3048 domain-containing protein [Candidatus Binatia bacterium]
MREQQQTTTAAQGKPPRRPWAVSFDREKFWRAAAVWSSIGFAAFVGAAAIGWAYWTGTMPEGKAAVAMRIPPSAPAAPVEGAAAPTRRRLIDGVAVPADAPEPTGYFAAAIDNLSVARPQSGIAKASLVFEAPVEGGITRFLAVFAEGEKVDRIGPVRSARPYFLDWAAEFDAMFVHVGGSPEALDKLRDYGMRDLNEFFAGAYFWRDPARSAPHNAYTSLDRLEEADKKRFSDRKAPEFASWRFKDDAPENERPEEAKVAIEYGDPRMDVSWTYDRASNAWRRSQGGRTKDADGTAILSKNIVVQYTKVSVIDDVGRRKIATVGEGDALIALDGMAVHGTWRKDERTSRTRFYDASGNQIRFNAGQTWIEVVPTGTKVDY